jgi:hypothetical protein
VFCVAALFAALSCATQVDEIGPTDQSTPSIDGASRGGSSSVAWSSSGSSGTSPGPTGGGSAGAAQAGSEAGGSSGSAQGGGEASGGAASGAAGSPAAAGSAGSAGTSEMPATCATQSFVYAAEGEHESVHVSGSFNAWAEPGTPLVYQTDEARWEVEVELGAGSHEYKFVLDGSEWIADPDNPESASDGFGGINSVIVVTCP